MPKGWELVSEKAYTLGVAYGSAVVFALAAESKLVKAYRWGAEYK